MNTIQLFYAIQSIFISVFLTSRKRYFVWISELDIGQYSRTVDTDQGGRFERKLKLSSFFLSSAAECTFLALQLFQHPMSAREIITLHVSIHASYHLVWTDSYIGQREDAVDIIGLSQIDLAAPTTRNRWSGGIIQAE